MALAQRNFDPIVNAKSQLSNKNRGWSQKARESALDRLSKIGLPSHRDEYWKYTNPTELITEKPNVSPIADQKMPMYFQKWICKKLFSVTAFLAQNYQTIFHQKI